ncbi:MAG: hypothetical protein A2Z91_08650 [Deltaproteobacteria bacterium GWA2_38_16]|nr:MAG: hypothetical protein A2Z91_08650 [Deltaproteobacteria bacterium GWA2_38_16]OGQ03863.1 MAG: hypothetical protein A3D19_07215 [Deltaproteobacteria bacterium RIFCSPHIGHO2_02_FULL_38_15]OGQ33329.1 MAG: hypothetical protein A3A72_08500 [Deltaproteobacteria bacterium RIFCSPLOWO2_01_FULL_38_9]OGQ59733.1 MAG: hypothetical protein A3G92_03640 [Deltaproteobacteria bacterium RIFCSPLOWO2_12_FULL_38_8]HBQ20909.1 hypothetical protein [Deltaproteobacteria bacterium]
MNKFKVTWILGGLFLILIAYVYFIEIKGGEKRKVEKEKEEKVWVFDKDKVESVSLKTEKGKFTAKRTGEKEWLLEEPLKVKADKLVWNNIVDSLYDLKFSRVVSEKADDLVPYGLKDSKYIVEITISGEKEKKILSIGDDNPVGDSVFVTVGPSQKVVLVPQFISSTLNKDIKDFREKKLFTFDETKTQEVTLEKAKEPKLVLKKEPGKEIDKWFILSTPKKEEADASKVTELLNTLNFLEVKTFEDESPKELAKYELNAPQLKVTIRDEKTAQLQLLFGKKTNDGVFVSKASEKPVYQVNATILDRLSLDPKKFTKLPEPKKENIEALPEQKK